MAKPRENERSANVQSDVRFELGSTDDALVLNDTLNYGTRSVLRRKTVATVLEVSQVAIYGVGARGRHECRRRPTQADMLASHYR